MLEDLADGKQFRRGAAYTTLQNSVRKSTSLPDGRYSVARRSISGLSKSKQRQQQRFIICSHISSRTSGVENRTRIRNRNAAPVSKLPLDGANGFTAALTIGGLGEEKGGVGHYSGGRVHLAAYVIRIS